MDPLEEPESRPPLPPRASMPPAPPHAALLESGFAHAPPTRVMDFLQRRLEGLEKELAVERERAQAAQSMLQQQEGLKSQVETQLKAMTDGLRREKAERDSEETKSHARGRIDALEKRLDEMHQSWVTLLREATSQREPNEQAGSKQELAALQGSMHALIEQIGQWRAESRAIAEVLPEIRSLASQLPADERRFEGQVGQMLSQFSAELRERVGAWERRQSLEMEKHEERLQAFAREKAALLRAFEEQNHQIRQDGLKEKIHRETQSGEQIAELARRVDELRAGAADSSAALARVLNVVTVPPKAKDTLIEALEGEKAELVKALKDRSASLQEHLGQRREVERTMGESLMALNRELDEAKTKQQTFSAHLSQLELDKARLADELASVKRLAQEKDQRCGVLEAERDQIAKALLAEADRARLLVEERGRSEDAWAARLSDLQSRLAAEIAAKTGEAAAVAELRGQLATLSDHMARALQERDAAAGRVGTWDKERSDFMKRLQEKEEMISMLNSTFQKFLKPGANG